MTEGQYLAGRLLLALPGMFDPRFKRSVNVMCTHDENGAFGIGVGHVRAQIKLHAMLKELDIDPGVAPDCAVLQGGPVEPQRGFVLHTTDWGGQDTLQVAPLCALSASLDILRAIAAGRGPSKWLIALGYAGWGAGQLENEMRHHGWHAAQGRPEILFEQSVESRWTEAWKAEGIDPALLASETGHA